MEEVTTDIPTVSYWEGRREAGIPEVGFRGGFHSLFHPLPQ